MLVVERGKEEAVERIFERWGLPIVAIGRVTGSGRAVLRFAGEVVADMPIAPLVDGAPRYERPVAVPTDLAQRQATPQVPLSDLAKGRGGVIVPPELSPRAKQIVSLSQPSTQP